MTSDESAALGERLKQYESKLAALSAINSALQKENLQLQKRIKRGHDPAAAAAEDEVAELKDEFTRRLGAADRSIEALRQERNQLQQQLQSAQSNISQNQVRLTALQQEAVRHQEDKDVLSNKLSGLEGTVKTLRVAQGQWESEREKMSVRVQQLEGQVAELQEGASREKLTLNNKVAELETMLHSSQSRLRQMETEAQDMQRQMKDREEQAVARTGAEVLATAQAREQSLLTSLAELRHEFDQAAAQWGKKESEVRREVQKLESRLLAMEVERDEVAASASHTTRPLLRQIESLVATAAARDEAATEVERKLMARVRNLEEALAVAKDQEQAATSRANMAEAAVGAAKEASHRAASTAVELRSQCDAEHRHVVTLEAEKKSAEERLRSCMVRLEGLQCESQAVQGHLKDQLAAAQATIATLREEQAALMSSLEARGLSREASAKISKPEGDAPVAPAVAPSEEVMGPPNGLAPLSIASGGSSQRGNQWGQVHDGVAVETPRRALQGAEDHSTLRRHVERLQAQVVAAERSRDDASEQLLRTLQALDKSKEEVEAAQKLRSEVASLNQRLDVLLELVGERNERVEQLEEDILEMKNIFHEQLQEAVEQLVRAQKEAEHWRTKCEGLAVT